MDDVLHVIIEDLVVVTHSPFGQVRHQHDQCCKFGRMLQMYHLVLIFENKLVLHNLIYYL